MLDPLEVILARRLGETRYSIVVLADPTLPAALAKFGLKSVDVRLADLDREAAEKILKDLLWKDQAYHCECMEEARAANLATRILDAHSSEGCKYYSNIDLKSTSSYSWMTDATFESGIIIARPDGIYVCIWFEDED